jgi:hypothetical protein
MTEKLKLVFAEGCFDGFEGTEAELAEVLAEIHQMVEDGTLMDDATPLRPEDEEEFVKMMQLRMPRQ